MNELQRCIDAVRGYSRESYRKLMRPSMERLATTLIALYGGDIAATGRMHEYYHPDTGEGLNNPGFQSWNLLVNNMIAWLEGRPTVEEF